MTVDFLHQNAHTAHGTFAVDDPDLRIIRKQHSQRIVGTGDSGREGYDDDIVALLCISGDPFFCLTQRGQ